MTAKSLDALPAGACEQSSLSGQTAVDESRIDSDVTLGTDADVVYAPNGLDVRTGATLTVEPGTTVVFEQRTELQVGGTLEASGSCSDPIAFVGRGQQPDYFRGVTFRQNGGGTLDHVLVENGGTARRGAVTVRSDGAVAMRNTEVRGGPGAAVAVEGNGTFGAFAANALAGTEGPAVRGSIRAMTALDDATAYGAASERPVVAVSSTVPDGATVAVDPLGVPIAIAPDGGGRLSVAGTLDVAPGTTFLFGPEGSLDVNGTGELVADASGGDPITFGALQETRGHWRGIAFRDATSTANVLSNVRVEYAGGGDSAQGLLLAGESRVTVENSAFAGNDGYGVRVRQSVTMDAFDGNAFEDNAAPIWTSGRAMHLVGSNNAFSGNDDDRVHVLADRYDGHAIPEGEDHTWTDPGVPLFLEMGRAGAFGVVGSLTLGPGLTLQMAQDHGIYVTGELATAVSADDLQADHSLTSQSEAAVTFEGEQATPGYWAGIAYDETRSPDNRLRYCAVRHAGGTRQPPATEQQEAAVMVLRGASLEFRDVLVEQSAGYGLFAQVNNELGRLDRLAFHDCEAPMYLYADSVSSVGRNVLVENNETAQIFLESPIGATDSEMWFEAPDVPFRILPSQVGQTLDVTDRMVVRDGAELRFEQDVGLVIHQGGSLEVRARGETEQVTDPDTVFRGVEAQPGWWQGIRYSQTTSRYNVISEAGIYHTGSVGWPNLAETADEGTTRAAVAATGAAEATVERCHVAAFEGAAFLESYTSNPNRADDVNATLHLHGNVVE